MSDPYFQELFADRIGGSRYGKGTAIYKFEKIKRAKRAAVESHPERPLLDFGIGENDDVADPEVRRWLNTEADKVENRGYADNGIAEYKEAAAQWMKREFGVTIDPATQVNHCIGSKSALAIFPLCFINPGDVTLMTVPGYPVAGTHTKYLGGSVHPLQLRKERGFLPDLESIPADILSRAKLLVLNYPNSPTGGTASVEFYENVIRFAKQHAIIVIQDAAHIMLTYGKAPLSFLQVPGAMEVGVEVHSMSKGFNMIGWRLGFVAGNATIVRAFADVKDNTDSGQFMAIQKAAARALQMPSISTAIRAKYERRLRKLLCALREIGFKAEMPGGTYFSYVPAPKGITGGPKFENAEEASQFLIKERSICTVPWDDAGAYLRFSVTYRADTEADEDNLMMQLIERLSIDKYAW